MRYVLFYLTIIMSAMIGACAGSAADDLDKVSVTASSSTTKLPTAKAENECKICGFDFANYKGELKRVEIEGLLLALNDEYLAAATYEQVNRDLGDPRPFVNIVEAEKRHAERLKNLFSKYDLKIPENPWPSDVPKFASVAEACEAGVSGELVNRDLYTRLFKSTGREDILETYRYLQRASEENHLPAFERCGGGTSGRRGGPR